MRKHPGFGHREWLGHPGKELNDDLDQDATVLCRRALSGVTTIHSNPMRDCAGRSLGPHLMVHRDLVRPSIWQGSFVMQFLNLDGSTTGKDKRVVTNAFHRVVTTAREKGQRWEMPT